MELPITEKELDDIIDLLKNHNKGQLYAKLWSFKINKFIKNEEKGFGFS
jgi:hypothetical protein